ncbi:MAG: recombination regulator RecX [Bacteroidales bacterium]|jgi:regulatory protein|nr:recombination regulator RecX [Bacteroidales bacterium]
MQNITVKEAREKAMQRCSRREYCRRDIFEKVVSWGCTPVEAREVVDFLVEQRFVDDRRYTEAFVRDKLQFNKWGRVKIAYMLRAQNIDKVMVVEILSEIDELEYRQVLTSELQKKYRTLRGTAFEIRGKLFRFATSRGFEPEMINEAISGIAGS